MGYPTEIAVVLRVVVDPAGPDADEAAGRLWDLGTVGVVEEPGALLAHFASAEQAEAARGALGWPSTVEPHVPHDWVTSWQDHARPTRAGRLLVHPPWVEVEPAAGDVVVPIDPRAAFGHGGHPTTRLLLEQLVRRVRGGESVLDVGCGSGVLAVAALSLGAASATAIDIDPDAVETTIVNARANDVADRLAASTRPITGLVGTFDLVVANATAGTLVALADPIERRAAGPILISGLLVEQVEPVAAAFDGEVVELRTDRGWAQLSLDLPVTS